MVTRRERDSFTAQTPDDLAYGEGACLETPRQVFEKLNERFHFDVDLTANEENHLLPLWFGPGSPCQDALTTPWVGTRATEETLCWSGFSNPPYGPFIPKILTKAIQEAQRGFTSVFLLPNRSAEWFKALVIPYYSDLWYLQSRLTFSYKGKPRLNPRTGKPDGALFDSIIVVYRPWRQELLFPPPVRPNVWNHKTGELRY